MVRWTEDDGAELRRLRESQGLTQRQVSVALDVAQAAVSGWERGESRPRKENALALGALIGDVDAVLAVCGYTSGDGRDLTARVAELERRADEQAATIARLADLLGALGVAVEAVSGAQAAKPRPRKKT